MSGDAWEAPGTASAHPDTPVDPRPAQRGWTWAVALTLTLQAVGLSLLAVIELLDFTGVAPLEGEGAAAAGLGLVMVLVGLGLLLNALAVAVTRIGWTWASIRHANAVGLDTEQTPGWGAAMWFIPIANLFMPYRIFHNLTTAAATQGDAVAKRLGPWLLPWWVLHLTATVIDRVLLQTAFSEETLQTTAFDLVASVVLIGAALAELAIVRGIHRILAPRAP